MLLTFVIVDDIGTVFVIAVFYSGDIQLVPSSSPAPSSP